MPNIVQKTVEPEMTGRTPFMLLRQAEPVPWDGEYPVFTRLAIETHSKCNRKCSFCPVSTGRRDFPPKHMSDGLFESICQQLEDVCWEGFVEFFVINEPLIDGTYMQKAARLRAATPRSTIYCSTNGDVVAGQTDPVAYMTELLRSGVNSVNLNVYDDGDAGAERLEFYQRLVADLERLGIAKGHHRKYSKVAATQSVVCVTDMRTDRLSKDSPLDAFFNKKAEVKQVKAPESYCARPHRHMLVLWDGRVPLCCAMDPTDPDGVYVGDANVDRLLDIWRSEAMAKHRYFLQQKERSALYACRNCHHRMAYPHAVRLTSAPEEKVAQWRAEEVELCRE